MCSLRTVEERGRSRDRQVEPRRATRVDLVDALAKGVETLLAHVGPHPLERLHLVEHEHEAWMARVAEDQEKAVQEAQRRGVVDSRAAAWICPRVGRGPWA